MEPSPPPASSQPGPVPGWQPPGEERSAWPDDPPFDQPPARPGLVTAAAIVLIVLGVLVGLLGLLFLVAGVMFGTIVSMPEFQDQFPDVSEAAGGVFVAFGLLFTGDGVLQVVAGIFVLPGRAWARIAGLIAALFGALIALVGVLPAEGGGGFNLFFVVMLAGYVLVAWVLITQGAWFRRR